MRPSKVSRSANYAIALAGVIIAITVLELFARSLIPANEINKLVFDPLLGHARPKSVSGRYTTTEFSTLVQFNQSGFRDSDWPEEKSADVFRIAVLGDSYVEGAQVERHELLTSRLQHYLLDPQFLASVGAHKVEVLNFGVSGYGTTQQLLLLQSQVFMFSPDLVILALLTGNDVRNNSIELEQGTRDWTKAMRPYFDIRKVPPELHLPSAPQAAIIARTDWRYQLLDSSRLLSFIYPRLARTEIFARILYRIGLLSDGNYALLNEVPRDFSIYLPADQIWEEAWESTRFSLSQIQRLSSERGSRFLLFMIPNREQVYPAVWRAMLDRYPSMRSPRLVWDLEAPNRQVAQFTKSTQIELIDALPQFRALAHNTSPGALYFPLDGHFTAAGHDFAARLIYTRLLNQSSKNVGN